MQRLVKYATPKTYQKLKRSMTMPSFRTLEGKDAAYLNFDLNTGRNSDFHTETLSEEAVEELGGTEYRALKWLTIVVPLVSKLSEGRYNIETQERPIIFTLVWLLKYFFGAQILVFTIFAPWLSTSKQYDPVFEAQPRLVNKTW
jgi:hypothetical protein